MKTSSIFPQLPENASFFGAHLPSFAKGIGLFLLVAPCVTYFISPALDAEHLLAHTLIVSPFVTATVYGGYWLEQSELSPRRWPRITRWFFGVLLAFLALNVMMMTLWGNSALYNFMWGLFAANIGSTGGLAIGIFEARTIEQERLAERRRMRQEAARRRSKQFEDFAKIVSHDLRNPLNVAGGRLELAREEHDSPHLAAVARALGRMDEIIEDVLMLTWSGQEIDPEALELHQIGEVATRCWSNVDAAGAQLQIEDNPSVYASARRLQRLLENLFRNAVEHGGTEVVVRIGALSRGFFVEDNGPGIPPDNRETVLKPGVSSTEEGTGLGLSIVKTIAEAHNWTVSVTSGREGGHGSNSWGLRRLLKTVIRFRRKEKPYCLCGRDARGQRDPQGGVCELREALHGRLSETTTAVEAAVRVA